MIGMEPEKEEEEKLYEKRLQQMQLEQKKKELLRRMLSDAAYERMMNVRLSAPEIYMKVVSSLAYIAQTRGMEGKISDEQLYSLLAKMSEKRETNIEFKRK